MPPEAPNLPPEDLENKLDQAFLSRYQLGVLLGRGGMGVVYRALDLARSRSVAIKFMSGGLFEGDDTKRRFHNEAKALEGLKHPNLVEVLDSGETQGQPYIVFEFVQGRTLKDLIQSRGSLPVYRSLEILQGILRGLEQAHGRQIIHRDIKSENVLLDAQETPLVADFGIAKSDQPGQTRTGVIIGTPAYMAPEQAMGKKLDHRADLYSVGIVLFEMLTGRLPFGAENSMTTMMAHIHQPVPAPSYLVEGLPQHLDELVGGALAKTPERRYPNAKSFAIAAEKTVERLKQVGFGTRIGPQSLPAPEGEEVDPATRVVHLGSESGLHEARSTPVRDGATMVVDRTARTESKPRVLESTRAHSGPSLPTPAQASRFATTPIPKANSWKPILSGGLVILLVGLGGWLGSLRGPPRPPSGSHALESPRAQILRDRLEELTEPDLDPGLRLALLQRIPGRVPEDDDQLRRATIERLEEILVGTLADAATIRGFHLAMLTLGDQKFSHELLQEAARVDQPEIRKEVLGALSQGLQWGKAPQDQNRALLLDAVWRLDRLEDCDEAEAKLFLSVLVPLATMDTVERLVQLLQTGTRRSLPPGTQEWVADTLIQISSHTGPAADLAQKKIVEQGMRGRRGIQLTDEERLRAMREMLPNFQKGPR